MQSFAGAPKHCTQAVYDAALLDVFGRSDGNTHRLQLPELVCFEEAHTPEEIYAQRLRALLLHQAEERRKLQEMVQTLDLQPDKQYTESMLQGPPATGFWGPCCAAGCFWQVMRVVCVQRPAQGTLIL